MQTRARVGAPIRGLLKYVSWQDQGHALLPSFCEMGRDKWEKSGGFLCFHSSLTHSLFPGVNHIESINSSGECDSPASAPPPTIRGLRVVLALLLLFAILICTLVLFVVLVVVILFATLMIHPAQRIRFPRDLVRALSLVSGEVHVETEDSDAEAVDEGGAEDDEGDNGPDELDWPFVGHARFGFWQWGRGAGLEHGAGLDGEEEGPNAHGAKVPAEPGLAPRVYVRDKGLEGKDDGDAAEEEDEEEQGDEFPGGDFGGDGAPGEGGPGHHGA